MKNLVMTRGHEDDRNDDGQRPEDLEIDSSVA